MKLFQSSIFAMAACALTVSVSAQTPPPTGAATQPKVDAHKTVTITGCLERAKENTTASDRTSFMLNNIAADASTTGTAGTSGSMTPKATSYRLDAEDSKLSGHVGHKVAITGTVEDRPMGTTGTPSTTGSTPEAPKLKVDNVKMIAASCTP